MSPLGRDKMSYELWVANQMGELIAAAPGMPTDPPIDRVTEFAPTYIDRISNGNVSAFARLVDVNKMTVYSWCRCRAVPRLDLLLKVCNRLGVTFSDLLIKDKVCPNLDLINQSLSQMKSTRFQQRHKTGEVRRALLAALEKNPAPTLREVAQSLGYTYPDYLYSRYSDLCKKLTARYRNSLGNRDRTHQPPNRTYPDDLTVKRAFPQALKKAVPPSLIEIASAWDTHRDMIRDTISSGSSPSCAKRSWNAGQRIGRSTEMA